MSLSFFITLSLLSSQAFLSKKLFPSPYEITHLIKKSSLKESDQKLVNILLNQDKKLDSFNPGVIYEMINKNSNYQEILQDIETNYQQISNKKITKTKSKSNSIKKIYLSFEKWKNQNKYDGLYTPFWYANKYLKNLENNQEIKSLLKKWLYNDVVSFRKELQKTTYESKLKKDLKEIASHNIKNRKYFDEIIRQIAFKIYNNQITLFSFFRIVGIESKKPNSKFKFTSFWPQFIDWATQNNNVSDDQINEIKKIKISNINFIDFFRLIFAKNNHWIREKLKKYLDLEISEFKIAEISREKYFKFKITSKKIDKNTSFNLTQSRDLPYKRFKDSLIENINANKVPIFYYVEDKIFTIGQAKITYDQVQKEVINLNSVLIKDSNVFNQQLFVVFKEKISNKKGLKFQKILNDWYLGKKEAFLQKNYQNYKVSA